jgi:hypothetical protein
MRTTNTIIVSVTVLAVTTTSMLITYWINTQPVWISKKRPENKVLTEAPKKNIQIINLIEARGKELAPNYKKVVCTEFVIRVIEQFDTLSKAEKNAIRILAPKNLDSLIHADSPVIKGVQTGLTLKNKGIQIDNSNAVMPGDFVQFWNQYNKKEYGHCGVVLAVIPNESLTVYSSHPMTDGYGKQKFLWPDKVYFVRLK